MTSIINHSLSLLFLLSLHPHSPTPRPISRPVINRHMDDTNMLAADCIIISCCCQCMILQILIFLLLKLPSKVLKKTKEYAGKIRGAARNKRTEINVVEIEMARLYKDDDIEDFCLVESIRFGEYCCCMVEIERVLGEFSCRGEFAFGSFWGAEVCSARAQAPGRSFRLFCKEEEIDYDDVGYRLMDLFGDVKLAAKRARTKV